MRSLIDAFRLVRARQREDRAYEKFTDALAVVLAESRMNQACPLCDSQATTMKSWRRVAGNPLVQCRVSCGECHQAFAAHVDQLTFSGMMALGGYDVATLADSIDSIGGVDAELAERAERERGEDADG